MPQKAHILMFRLRETISYVYLSAVQAFDLFRFQVFLVIVKAYSIKYNIGFLFLGFLKPLMDIIGLW